MEYSFAKNSIKLLSIKYCSTVYQIVYSSMLCIRYYYDYFFKEKRESKNVVEIILKDEK